MYVLFCLKQVVDVEEDIPFGACAVITQLPEDTVTLTEFPDRDPLPVIV